MPSDKRRYITVANDMPEHPKVEALSDKAFRLVIDLWCYCSRNTTDGRVPAATWARRGTAKARGELLAAPLAELLPNGDVLMRDYLKHQQSADELAAQRAKKQAAGQKGGLTKAANRKTAKDVAPATASASATAKQMLKQNAGADVPAVAVAVEVLPSEAPSTSGGGAAAASPTAETEGQRVNRLTRTYADAVPLSNFPAVAGVVRKAVRSERYSDEQIRDALTRLAQDNRPVTVDTLRIELDGLPTARRGGPLADRMAVGYGEADRHSPARTLTPDEWAREGRTASGGTR